MEHEINNARLSNLTFPSGWRVSQRDSLYMRNSSIRNYVNQVYVNYIHCIRLSTRINDALPPTVYSNTDLDRRIVNFFVKLFVYKNKYFLTFSTSIITL